MSDPLEFAIDLAIQTGNLLQKYYKSAGLQVSQKVDRTVVTEADLAADRLITENIQQHYPMDKIISEESFHQLESSDSPTWIIDPLDGTTNFSLGLSIWGVSIARIIYGYPELGVLYFPMINELYITKKGDGSTLNHVPITTHAQNSHQSLSFFTCCSRTFRNYNISIPYKPRIMGSGVYSFCMLARGAAVLGFDAESKIWDLAAAWLLVEEAGGKIATFEGSGPFPISTNDDYALINYPTLAAANPDVFEFGRNRIQKKSISEGVV